MNDNNNERQSWWQRNKKKVLIIGGVVAAIGIGYIIVKNKDPICEFIKQADTIPNGNILAADSHILESIPTEQIVSHSPINNGDPFDVSGHIRNLANGHHASAEKIAEAAELGITLGENQTLVSAYMKNAA